MIRDWEEEETLTHLINFNVSENFLIGDREMAVIMRSSVIAALWYLQLVANAARSDQISSRAGL
ncbi:hypothetical protein [Chlorogloeopsis fritschii]|uniref:hypothetical protein n=1 Tax=Chlorogloeopsis fritschii TaxID=1124 RepID=UPI0023F0BE1F|nr:hypothetical protein [Chlorogloeopsis fritschii]